MYNVHSECTEMEAVRLRGGKYAVRPAGALGACGWIDGKSWTVRYVTATSEAMAIKKALNNMRGI